MAHLARHRSKKQSRAPYILGLAALGGAVGLSLYFLTRKPVAGGSKDWHPVDPTKPLGVGIYRISAPDQWPAAGLNTSTAVISEFYGSGAGNATLPADWQNMPGAAADAQAAGVSGDADGRDRMEVDLSAPLQLQNTAGVLVWAAQ